MGSVFMLLAILTLYGQTVDTDYHALYRMWNYNFGFFLSLAIKIPHILMFSFKIHASLFLVLMKCYTHGSMYMNSLDLARQ